MKFKFVSFLKIDKTSNHEGNMFRCRMKIEVSIKAKVLSEMISPYFFYKTEYSTIALDCL